MPECPVKRDLQVGESENTEGAGRAGLSLGKSMNTPPRARVHFFLSYSLIDLPALP